MDGYSYGHGDPSPAPNKERLFPPHASTQGSPEAEVLMRGANSCRSSLLVVQVVSEPVVPR
jgi:hypothetical protein